MGKGKLFGREIWLLGMVRMEGTGGLLEAQDVARQFYGVLLWQLGMSMLIGAESYLNECV